MWRDSLQLDADGFMLAPTEPGLGLRLSEQTKARYSHRPGSEEWVDVPGKRMPRHTRRSPVRRLGQIGLLPEHQDCESGRQRQHEGDIETPAAHGQHPDRGIR